MGIRFNSHLASRPCCFAPAGGGAYAVALAQVFRHTSEIMIAIEDDGALCALRAGLPLGKDSDEESDAAAYGPVAVQTRMRSAIR